MPTLISTTIIICQCVAIGTQKLKVLNTIISIIPVYVMYFKRYRHTLPFRKPTTLTNVKFDSLFKKTML